MKNQYTLYSKEAHSNAWIFYGSYSTASEAVKFARILHGNGHKVEIDSSEVPVVSDFYD